MAAVARGHGGDAGGDPPPGPRRVPTTCEQGSRKRGRDRARDLKLIQAYDNNGKRPLPIEFDVSDQQTYQPIGNNDPLFIRFIGNWIGNNIPMCYENWDYVPKNEKIGILPWIQQYFDLTPHRVGPHWDQISKDIDRLCRDRYKDRKAKQKKHFLDNGGYDDVEKARKHPPPSVKKDVWDQTIDHFLDPKYRNPAEKNAKNIAKARFPSLHGSSSYVSTRYKQKNPKTQELPGWIDNWRRMHTRSGEWVNDTAQSYHERMIVEKESLTQQHESDSLTPINESQILSKVLGEHRGHKMGRGRKLKGDSSSSIFDRSEYTMPPQRSFTDDEVRDMASNISAFVRHSNETHTTLVQAIRSINPNADVPDIPTFSFTMPVVPPPPSSPQQNTIVPPPPLSPQQNTIVPPPPPSSSLQNTDEDNDEDLGND